MLDLILRFVHAGGRGFWHNAFNFVESVVRQPNPDLGPYLVLRYEVFFLMDSVSLGISDDQTENWNFPSVEQFKI